MIINYIGIYFFKSIFLWGRRRRNRFILVSLKLVVVSTYNLNKNYILTIKIISIIIRGHAIKTYIIRDAKNGFTFVELFKYCILAAVLGNAIG